MASRIINMTVPENLLRQIDRVAAAEGRTRSELFREAARRYIEERRRPRPRRNSSGLLSRLAASAEKGPNISAADIDRLIYRSHSR